MNGAAKFSQKEQAYAMLMHRTYRACHHVTICADN